MSRFVRMRVAVAMTAAALGLAACGGSTTGTTGNAGATPSSSAADKAGKAVTVGLAYDIGGRGDKSFNDAAAVGLDKAVTDLGVKTQEVSVSDGGSDRVERLTLLADAGVNPIIAVGFLYADAVKQVAAAYPATKFAIVDDASFTAPNVTSLVFAEEQSSFLVGAAAALKTTTGNVGFIGGVQTPLIEKFEAGFTAGAKQVKSDAKVQVKYLTQPPDFSGFGSPDKGKIAAQGMYDAGADIVYAAAGGSGTGVFEAAVASGKKAIGVDSDQYLSVGASLQPVIITSALKRVDVAVSDFIAQYVGGSVKAGEERFDLANNGVGYATSGGAVDDISAQLEALKAKIIKGEIKVPTTP